jgi:NitT/TauT family transport system substrate-binding protein
MKIFRMATTLGLFLGALGTLTPARADDIVTFATDWTAQAEQGGFYQALASGLYAKRGLTVRLHQGGPQTNTAQLIAAGAVDLAIGSNSFFVPNFLQAGAPVKAVMASFQKDPQVLITHPRDDVKSIADMKGRPILLAKDSLTTFWPWLKQKFGFSDAQIRPYTFNMAPFLVDAKAIQEGYLGSEPHQIAKASGTTPQVYLLADEGYPGYAAMVLARQDLIDKKPEVVRAFVEASIEGWHDYLHGDPGPGNRLIKQNNPDMTDDLLAYGITAMKEHGIVESGDAISQGIGTMTDARWKGFSDQMVALGLYPATLTIKTGYTLQFLPGSQAR